MKVSRRSYPMDSLSFIHKEYEVSIHTHQEQLIVGIEKDGMTVMDEWMTADQFISLLMTQTEK